METPGLHGFVENLGLVRNSHSLVYIREGKRGGDQYRYVTPKYKARGEMVKGKAVFLLFSRRC